ncbi:MAG: xanthine dehydrogenase family protein molybdopterin-binding subunit, partial [Acidobacteriota bacterium]
RVPGVRHVLNTEFGLAVCADSIEAAWNGRAALNMKWTRGAHPTLDSQSLERDLVRRLKSRGAVARADGDVKSALNGTSRRLKSVFYQPYLAHAALEPINCTAHVRPQRCSVWVPTQNQSAVLAAIAKITGLKPQQIDVYTTYLGGGFGRRLETDFVQEAVHISKATGRPVKVFWSREEDMRNDFYRPASCTMLEGSFDRDGQITGLACKVVAPSVLSRIAPQFIENGVDPVAVDGMANALYGIPNFTVEYVRDESPVQVGIWRSGGYSHNIFALESFIDELAYAAQKDPLELRLALLKDHPRAVKVLATVAERARWGKSLPPGRAMGIAFHAAYGSFTAQVAEVSVDEKRGKVKVHRVVCAIDCGPNVNPNIIAAQMEGGIVFGLSVALKERVEFANGGVLSDNFNNYEILTMSETPIIEVHIVKGDERELGGVSELGVPAVAPAVANAIFAATRVRVRNLPMSPRMVSRAIASVRHPKAPEPQENPPPSPATP